MNWEYILAYEDMVCPFIGVLGLGFILGLWMGALAQARWTIRGLVRRRDKRCMKEGVK